MISLKRKTLAGILFTLVFIFFAMTPALAEDNVISSVTISKAKDKANSYELNIDSTQQVHYKSNIDEDGNIYFDLKNSVLAEDLGTIYDDVSKIDNVVVKQVDKNKVRIYVKGDNARNTELIFVNSLFETQEDSGKKITINRPISAYQPTSREADLENQEDIQDWDDNSFNLSHLLIVLLNNLKEGGMGIVLIALSLITMFAIIIKTLAKKITQDKEPLIGLNTARILNNETKKDTQINSRMIALQNAQQELNKAHQKYQTYIQNKYGNKEEKPQVDNLDALTKSIALNQYQRSTKNPYLDQEVIKIKQELSNKEESFKIPPRPKRNQPNDFTSPYIRRTENKINYTPKKVEKQNSMKFLESVTKIYEQSGRKDLATGLKNSISKAKQTI